MKAKPSPPGGPHLKQQLQRNVGRPFLPPESGNQVSPDCSFQWGGWGVGWTDEGPGQAGG